MAAGERNPTIAGCETVEDALRGLMQQPAPTGFTLNILTVLSAVFCPAPSRPDSDPLETLCALLRT